MKIVKDENLQISNQKFDNDCSMEISVRKSQLNQVLGKFDKIEGLKSVYILTL